MMTAAIASVLSLALAPASPAGTLAAARHRHGHRHGHQHEPVAWPPFARYHLPPVAPSDRAATYAYLEAEYAYVHALVDATPASLADAGALVKRVSGECPNVVAGAPNPNPFGGFWLDEEPSKPPTRRQTGEANRAERQLTVLRGELGFALSLALAEPVRQATLADARLERTLHWSEGDTTTQAHAQAEAAEWRAMSAEPSLCADLAGWAQSGFQALAPGTKALLAQAQAHDGAILRLDLSGQVATAKAFLDRSAGPKAKALKRRTQSLADRWAESLAPFASSTEAQLSKAVGLPLPPGPPPSHPPGSRLLAHGGTPAGPTYKIWLPPKPAHPRARCAVQLVLEEAQVDRNRKGEVTGGGGASGELCLSRAHPHWVTASCDRGQFDLEGQTKPGAVRARLTLANGRTITSALAAVPATDGGPVGYYYQRLRGRGPAPVSLAELGAHGHTVATVRFGRMRRCVARPFRNHPVHYLPGGIRKVASGRFPDGGPAFSIRGERYRFEGRTYFQLRAEVPQEPEVGLEGSMGPLRGATVIASSGSSGFVVSYPGHRPPPTPFELEEESGCQPREHALLYGILKAPRDTVLARTSAGLQPLTRVPFPGSLHQHSVLAYIALEAMPTELIVKAPGGRTVARADLRAPARGLREECEGEAEGAPA